MKYNFAIQARTTANSAQLLLDAGDLRGARDFAYLAMMQFNRSDIVKSDRFSNALDRFIVMNKITGRESAPVREDVEWAVAEARSLILEV